MSRTDVVAVESTSQTYGFSALLSALRTMWRASIPALVAIIVNAVVQSLLVYWNVPIGLNAGFVISLVLSAVAIVYCFALLSRSALSAVDGKVSLSQGLAQTREVLGGFTVWAVILIVAVVAALLISPIAAWLLLVVVPFVPLAAADGHGNALVANFRAIKDRFGRWLVTAFFVTLVGLVLFLLTSVDVLFVKGFPASLVAWFGLGLISWWILTAWALVYRNTSVGAAPDLLVTDVEITEEGV
jgi:hypothetical protein